MKCDNSPDPSRVHVHRTEFESLACIAVLVTMVTGAEPYSSIVPYLRHQEAAAMSVAAIYRSLFITPLIATVSVYQCTHNTNSCLPRSILSCCCCCCLISEQTTSIIVTTGLIAIQHTGTRSFVAAASGQSTNLELFDGFAAIRRRLGTF